MPQRARVGRVDRRSASLAEIQGYVSLQTSGLASTCRLHGSGGSRDPTARRTTMFDTASASNGVKLALLEGQLLTREIDRATFIGRGANLGLPAPAIGDAADKFMAIAAYQAARRATLRSSYDYIVIGSGASGSVVARRLAENQDAQVLLLEAGGEDLKPGILITETWFFNQGGEFDWDFAAERSPSVTNRSIARPWARPSGEVPASMGWSGLAVTRTTSTTGPRKPATTRGITGTYSTSTGASRTGTAFRIHNGAVAAVRSSFSPLPIQAPSRRPSSGPQSPWASRPSPTRTASCRKVRAARRSPMCVSATAAG